VACKLKALIVSHRNAILFIEVVRLHAVPRIVSIEQLANPSQKFP
jgi:hypothetical protein